jgi:hypothetical protein
VWGIEPEANTRQTVTKIQVPLRQKDGTMENNRVELLACELAQLLKKQVEVLDSRSLGSATDLEILEYELRQEIVHEICNQLANSNAI